MRLIWGLSTAEGLLSQADSQIAAAAFDGEKWADQVSDGSLADRQAHRLVLFKKNLTFVLPQDVDVINIALLLPVFSPTVVKATCVWLSHLFSAETVE